MVAMIDAKGLSATLSATVVSEAASPSDTATSSVEPARLVSTITIAMLNDQALRVVREVVGKPAVTLAKLYERYDSKSTATLVYKISELVAILYKSV